MGCRNIGDFLYRYTSPTIDNFVARLCYRWTVNILIVFSFIITCKLALGYSFSCEASNNALNQNFLDSHCYFETLRPTETYRLYTDRYSQIDDTSPYLTFYPWVNLVLLAQACIFYLPHILWKTYESGYMRKVTAGLEISLGKEQKRSLEILCLAKFVLLTRNRHRLYTYVFIFFEFCNFVISVSLLLWLKNFFNITAPYDYTQTDLSIASEYRNHYFPSLARCQVRKSGTTGDIRTIDALCTLPLNNLYMKLYLFLQAWYIIVAVCTGLVLIYRAALIAKVCRKKVLRLTVPPELNTNEQSVCSQLSYTDLFFLNAIKQCILDTDYSKLIDKILILLQSKVKDLNYHKEDDDQSSVYEDSHKDLHASTGTPL